MIGPVGALRGHNVWATAVGVWKEVARLFFAHRVLFIPFLIIAVLEFLALIVVMSAPHAPFSHIFAPAIRLFWGERFLHYPYHYLLLPRLFGYARLGIAVLASLIATGVVIRMIRQAKQGSRPEWKDNLSVALNRYLKLFAVWALIMGSVALLFRVTQFVIHRINEHGVSGAIGLNLILLTCFILGVALQVLFIYGLPAIMLEDSNLVKSVKRAFFLGRRLFLSTFVLTIIPTLPYLFYHSLSNHLPFLMQRLFPEIALILLGLGILLHVVVDLLVTASTTILFIRESQ